MTRIELNDYDLDLGELGIRKAHVLVETNGIRVEVLSARVVLIVKLEGICEPTLDISPMLTFACKERIRTEVLSSKMALVRDANLAFEPEESA